MKRDCECPRAQHAHGTTRAYTADHCRCDECRAAHTAASATRRRLIAYGRWDRSPVPVIGSRRRVHALMTQGWSMQVISGRLGMSHYGLEKILRNPGGTTLPATAARIAAIYNELWDQTPPRTCWGENVSYSKAINHARRRGYLPPMAYSEELIDNPDPEVDALAAKNSGHTRWTPFETRFWGQIDKTETCWLWTGKLDPKGYGQKVGYLGRPVRPHRLAYELLVGGIPDGLVIDHLCRVRHCVNPDHLEPVTAEENTRRGTDARWLEDCPNGHPASLYRTTLPSGKNICVECRRLSNLRSDHANRAERRAGARERYAARATQIDEVAVERIMGGELHIPPSARSPERVEAIRRLAALGLNDHEIGERIGMKPTSVCVSRTRNGIPAASSSAA